MGRLREWITRLGVLMTRRTRAHDDDLGCELEFHRDMIEADLVRKGCDAAEARRRASLEVGGRAQVLEAYAEQRSWRFGEELLQDLRYGARTFARTPGFTVTVLVTLALGVATTTTMLTVVQAVLLRPLPYAAPDRLVQLSDSSALSGIGNIGYGTFTEFRDRARTFDGLATVRSWQTTLVTTETERLSGMRVSWNYFELLGVRPALGRSFTATDDRPTGWRVIVLSDGLWRRRFSADPGVIGRSVQMNDQTYQVIGVMPAGFEDLIAARYYQPAELWAALGYDATVSSACRSCRHLKAFGRLALGRTVGEAAGELNVIRAELAAQYPSDYAEAGAGVVALTDVITGQVRTPLLILLGAAAFVLLIACANVASLLLARGSTRMRELAVRAAIGAGRGRILRQLVTESLLLWILGGLAGAALASLAIRVLIAGAPVALPRGGSMADGWVLGAALALSALTGLSFGALPALASSRALAPTLSGGRGHTGASTRLREVLVIADLAVALVLLVGAGLLTRSVGRLLDVDPGFRSERVLTAQFALGGRAYAEAPAVRAFGDRLMERITSLPGVEAVALAGQVPMGGNRDQYGLYIDGLEPARGGDAPFAERYSVTPGYFEVMQIPLLRGRLLLPSDTEASEPVALISDTAARTLFSGLDPIGRRMKVGSSPGTPWRTIVGIVGDVHHVELSEEVWPQMYLPQAQFTDGLLVLTVRTAGADPTRLAPALRRIMRELDPSIPMYQVASLSSLVAESSARLRFAAMVLVGFSIVSLLLAAVGLYGVVAFSVSRRTREVGVRVALGARPSHVLQLILRSGSVTIGAGLLSGLVLALPLAQLLEAELFGVQPFDPPTLAMAVAVLLAVAAAAHVVPVRRALRVDPTIALRDE